MAYHPTLGTWIQRDPAGYLDGENLRQYVQSNPIHFIDSAGLGIKDGVVGKVSSIEVRYDPHGFSSTGSIFHSRFIITVKGEHLECLEITQWIKNSTELWDTKGQKVPFEKIDAIVDPEGKYPEAVKPNHDWVQDSGWGWPEQWLDMDSTALKENGALWSGQDTHKVLAPTIDPKQPDGISSADRYAIRTTREMAIEIRDSKTSKLVQNGTHYWSYTLVNFAKEPRSPVPFNTLFEVSAHEGIEWMTGKEGPRAFRLRSGAGTRPSTRPATLPTIQER